MATTPQGDDPNLRRLVVQDMARKVAQVRLQRTMSATRGRPRSLTARPMLRQGQASK